MSHSCADASMRSAFVAVFLGFQHLWYFPRIYYLENRRKQAKIQGNKYMYRHERSERSKRSKGSKRDTFFQIEANSAPFPRYTNTALTLLSYNFKPESLCWWLLHSMKSSSLIKYLFSVYSFFLYFCYTLNWNYLLLFFPLASPSSSSGV